VEEPRLSPDGRWVAYVVASHDVEADRPVSHLWLSSWDGATSVQLTTGGGEAKRPRWSPDGAWLAFLAARGDEAAHVQVWLLPAAGGEARQLTSAPEDVEDFAWSPDGSRLVVVRRDAGPPPAGAEGGKAPPPIVIDRYYFKEDETGYLTGERRHLFLVDVATRREVALTRGEREDLNPAWSPDGRSLAFVSQVGADGDRTLAWEVFVVEARPGAAPRQLTRFEGATNNPGGEGGTSRIAWSPDGTQLAFLQGGAPRLLYYAPTRLATVPAAGGPVRVLTAGLDRWVTDPAWAPDGSLLALVEEDRAQRLVRIPAAGGAPVPLLDGPRAVGGFDVGRDGRIAALFATARTLPEVHAQEGPGWRPLSRQNDALLAELQLAELEPTSFTSRDGTAIAGFVMKPIGWKAGTRYPAVLRLHGGPVGQFTWGLDLPYDPCWQLLAAKGYLVILPNPRGSLGRGQDFASAILGEWGQKDAEDVLAAVDDAVARGLADPARLGVGGWSYGGILTDFLIARDGRFKAATSGAGMGNMLAGYGGDMYVREWEAELGTPWAAPERWLALSAPFLHADRITTPTLFLVGEKDFNVPAIGSEQMYQALRSLGRTTRLVIYPGQFHELTRPSYVRDRAERTVGWYDRFLK
jgi:dipeptidyl aminopeptidase/acylaminoacyl peptidase